MFNRYSNILVAVEYDDYDVTGKLVTKRWLSEEVGPYTALIPKTDCCAMIEELEAALVPAGYEVARVLARCVIGRYGRRELNDPDIYVVELTRVFAEASADLGDKAADSLRSCKFLPNVGDVMAVLTPLVEERRRALRQVQAHLAEHSRRAGEGAGPGEHSKLFQKFKNQAPAIKAAVGDDAFKFFLDTLLVVSDDGNSMVVAQPTRWLRDITAQHVVAISKIVGRKIELVIKRNPATGPRPIGGVLKGS